MALIFLPLPLAYKFARKLGRLQYRVSSSALLNKLRNTISSRLGVEPEEAEEVIERMFERAAMEKLEGGIFRLKSKKRIETLLQVQNAERLDHALKKGHGCILYAAHFYGRWTCFGKLGLLGYQPTLVRQMSAEGKSRMFYWFQDRFNALCASKLDLRFLWVESTNSLAALKSIEHLKKNGVLIFLVDVSTYAGRVVEVDFLNRQEQFPIGPALLSQLTKAPLISFETHYSVEDGHYSCQIGEEFVASDDALDSVQHIATQVEGSIRSHPEDWAGWQKDQYL